MSEIEGRKAAILRPTEAARHIDVGRREPAADLTPWVDYFWWVRWTAERPHVQRVIPQMCVHVAAEGGHLYAYGIMRSGFERTLTGTGHVIGVSFRPGCFRPFLKSSVGALSDRNVPTGALLPVDDRPTAHWLLEPNRTDDELVDGISGWLRSLEPEHDPIANDIAELVAVAERDRSIVRADQLADLAGVSIRTLQRQFSEYVGIGPKWVIQRCRMLDVAAAAHGDEPVDWAALSADLGFSDQSHLTRAWTKLVGEPPARYVAAAQNPVH